MTAADWILLALLGVLVLAAGISVIRRKGRGGCSGCSGCSGCGQCTADSSPAPKED